MTRFLREARRYRGIAAALVAIIFALAAGVALIRMVWMGEYKEAAAMAAVFGLFIQGANNLLTSAAHHGRATDPGESAG